jgi:hypothetical protein
MTRKTRIGILQTDSVLEEFRPEFGDYPAMFTALLESAAAERITARRITALRIRARRQEKRWFSTFTPIGWPRVSSRQAQTPAMVM